MWKKQEELNFQFHIFTSFEIAWLNQICVWFKRQQRIMVYKQLYLMNSWNWAKFCKKKKIKKPHGSHLISDTELLDEAEWVVLLQLVIFQWFAIGSVKQNVAGNDGSVVGATRGHRRGNLYK